MPKPLLIIIYAATGLLAAVAAYKYLLPVLLPFIIAFLFCILIEPLIIFLQKKLSVPRGVAVAISMVTVLGGILIVLVAIVFRLVAELIRLSVTLPDAAAELKIFYCRIIEKAAAFYVSLPPGITSSLEQNINKITDSLQNLAARAINALLFFISFVPETLTIFVVSLIATYFLARDRQLIKRSIVKYLPPPLGEKTIFIAREVVAAFSGYLRAQLVLVAITTLISIIGLKITGAAYALTLGLLVGLFDLIPVLGPATIYLPWAVWCFLAGSPLLGIKLIILYSIILVVRQLSEPRIVSANLGIHPLAALLAMYAGLKLFGVAGLVAGPLLLIAVQAVFKAGISVHKVK